MKRVSLCLATLALWGGDPITPKDLKPKMLPAAMGAKLQRGYHPEEFSWAWKGPGFKAQDGYRLAGFQIQSEERDGKLFNLLRQRLEMESDPGSSSELSLSVVDYWAGLGTQDRWICIEGQVKKGGKVVGAFVTRNSRDKREGSTGMIEDFMKDLTNYLCKQ